MRNIYHYIDLAIETALRRDDERRFLLGAVGLRADGAIVRSVNGAPSHPVKDTHAETRLIRQLDFGATVFVARVRRLDGTLAIARPCKTCLPKLRARKVKRVYYTIGPNEFGWIDFERNIEYLKSRN